jgi:hypothetical protein
MSDKQLRTIIATRDGWSISLDMPVAAVIKEISRGNEAAREQKASLGNLIFTSDSGEQYLINMPDVVAVAPERDGVVVMNQRVTAIVYPKGEPE